MNKFLKTTADKLFIYKTPKKVIKLLKLKQEKIDLINPPYEKI